MNPKLKLGWLFPYSGMFRNLRRDLQQGFESALKKEGVSMIIESYAEFVLSGGMNEAEQGLKKLLQFEEVDLVIGVLSNKVVTGLLPLAAGRQTPVIILNLGADIPSSAFSSDYLFYNSLHLWKSEWAMGYWAQKKYGGEPSINMSTYDSGYGLHEAFRIGATAAGAATVKLNMVRNMEGTADISPLIKLMEHQQPPHVHILLSGKEGRQFMQLFQELETPPGLTVNPFMVYGGLAGSIRAGLDIYHAATWSPDPGVSANRSFIEGYISDYGETPHAFTLLAYEAGLALAAAIRDGHGKTDRDAITASLGRVSPEGPRGNIHLSTRPLRTDLPVYIRKTVQYSREKTSDNLIVQTLPGIEWDDPSFFTGQANSSGWQNPYLCV